MTGRSHLTIEQTLKISDWLKTNFEKTKESDKALAVRAAEATGIQMSVAQFARVRVGCGYQPHRNAGRGESGIKARITKLEKQVETLIEEVHALRGRK